MANPTCARFHISAHLACRLCRLCKCNSTSFDLRAQVQNALRQIIDPHEKKSLERSGFPDIVFLEQIVDEVLACHNRAVDNKFLAIWHAGSLLAGCKKQ
eukprot:5143260-Pleurochrysis_carterae.AAC.1